ncbi:MAG TPA: RdgB/HAM1 family non-canonical purine NTP pyrophosphatase [Streptosporangiaceae bacterium]|nr:RdgB/HAM1 family non-canonical purine NTP pyrophosphatase [Streptosporangiaceae bacterium]
MTEPPKLVLASANPGKLIELKRILKASDVPVAIVGLDQFPGAPDVAETGATFAENALLKAHAIAEFTGLPAVADDSGICAEALNGMPGVLSARWSGRHGDDAANLALLLAQLADVPEERRGAFFAAAAALVVPSGQEVVSEGTLHGRLISEPRGTNGFGYDPIFVPEGESRTTAELSPAAKDAISHRGRALRGLAPAIAEHVAGSPARDVPARDVPAS